MKEVKREYNMSNAELCMLASNFVVFMNRDSAFFVIRGVDAADITAFQALGDAFEVFPTDDDYVGLIMIEVNAKNALRDSLMLKIQSISGYLEQKWGLRSGQYRRLGIKGVERLGDDLFLVKSREVARIAEEYISDLSPIGLTQADIDALNADAQLFEDKMNAVKDAKAIRDSKTQERAEKGNELYSFVKQYSTIGKLIWENIDEAKYNDYIIYKTTQSGLSKPQNLAAAFDPLNPSPVTLTWDLVANATSYDVYYNVAATGAPAGSFTLLNTFPTSPALVPPIFEKRNYYKIKAKNDSDTSPYSDEVWADIPAAP